MTRSQQLEVVITQAYSELPQLQILADMISTDKIQKIVVIVKESQAEMNKDRFELQLQILKLELKLQTTTPSEVREKRRAIIKEEMVTSDAIVKGCTQLFEQTTKLWNSLHEDPTLQKLNWTSGRSRGNSMKSGQQREPQLQCKGSPGYRKASSSRSKLMRCVAWNPSYIQGHNLGQMRLVSCHCQCRPS